MCFVGLQVLGVAFCAGFLCGMLMEALLKELTGREGSGCTALLAAVVTVAPVAVYGTGLRTLGIILFGQALLYASEHDLATRTVPDHASALILLAGLVELEPASAPLGLVLVPLPFLAAALVKEGSIGGGDIKLMGASGFVLGVRRGYAALMLGLLLAVAFRLVIAKKGNESFALVPYLAAGCLLAALV